MIRVTNDPVFRSQPAPGAPAAGGDQAGQARPQSKRLQQTQAQVDEVSWSAFMFLALAERAQSLIR